MYRTLLADAGMNYTLNRVLTDQRLAEITEIAAHICDFETWGREWLSLAERAEHERRWLDAASYYHQAEFYLPASPERDALYDAFGHAFSNAVPDERLERHRVPYGDGYLPALRIEAEDERAILVVHGGYDSFVEEFYAPLSLLAPVGLTVIAFDGPGQGGALRRGIRFTHEWERPAKAVLDHFGATNVAWLGISWGGLLALRAAAFEPRIDHVIAHPALFDGLEVIMRQLPPGQDVSLRNQLWAEDRDGVETTVAVGRRINRVFDWAVTQGMHITGAATPYELLRTLSLHTMSGIAHLVRQDVLLTAGNVDHLTPADDLYRVASELVSARSVTTRLFTETESAGQHCQMGNQTPAAAEMIEWLRRLQPVSHGLSPAAGRATVARASSTLLFTTEPRDGVRPSVGPSVEY